MKGQRKGQERQRWLVRIITKKIYRNRSRKKNQIDGRLKIEKKKTKELGKKERKSNGKDGRNNREKYKKMKQQEKIKDAK